MASVLSDKHFHDEAAAYRFVEKRVWPDGPVCPRCDSGERIGKLKGKSTRPGVYKCYACRKPFSVKVGTIFESSHVPLHLWLQAIFLMASSKKGLSANQLHRTLGLTLKTAWFLAHRIREAMRSGDLAPLGGNSGTVEVDETYIGHDKTVKPKGMKRGRGAHHKYKILSLVDRNTGEARSFKVDKVDGRTIIPIIRQNIDKETVIMTDEAAVYGHLKEGFEGHEVVRHSRGEYGRGPIHTNTIEGYFSIFKRGMKGVYQHCGEKHIHRYLAEYDFRYNNRMALGVNDASRAERLLKGVAGKRLTYRTAN